MTIGIPYTAEDVAKLDEQLARFPNEIGESGRTLLDGISAAVERMIPVFDAAGWPREAIGAVIAGSFARTVPTLPIERVVVYSLYITRNLPGATHVDLPEL